MSVKAVGPKVRGHWFRWGVALLAVAVAGTLVAFLAGFHRQQSASMRELWALRLETMASQGAREARRVLDAWETDAGQLAGFDPLVRYLRSPSGATGREAEAAAACLGMPKSGYGYEGALLLGADGGLVLSRPESLATAELLKTVRPMALAQKSGSAFCSGPSGVIRAVSVAPVRTKDGGPSLPRWLGSAVVVADPSRALFPALDRTARIEPPAKVVLAKVTSDAVLLLGNPDPGPRPPARPRRFTGQPEPRLRPPVGSGMEAWGDEVYAVGEGVPGTPWTCLAFVGREDALRDHRRTLGAYAATAAGLYLSLGFFLYVLAHRREMQHLRRLGETERRHATLLANLPGIAYRCVNDTDWTMEFISEGCLDLTGFHAEQLLGNSELAFGDLIHPDDRGRVWEEVQAALARESRFTLAYRIRTREGRTKYVWEQGAGVKGPDGRIQFLEGFITDVSPRVEAEERLRLAQDELSRARALEAVGLVAGGVAHEVRNPLFAIETIVLALAKKTEGMADLAEYHQHLKDQVRRLKDLMKDLLDLGRPIPVSEFTSVHLGEILAGSVQETVAAREGDRGRVLLESAPQAPTVRGIPGSLRQVFVNLIQNALQFSEGGAAVRVTSHATQSEVTVTVSDEGPGISPEVLPRLFEPFVSRRKGGTGLGLAIARKIVEAHGGTISAANNAPGPGAAFTVRLPLLWGEGKPVQNG
jgi:PAS domain S-box-containing protein